MKPTKHIYTNQTARLGNFNRRRDTMIQGRSVLEGPSRVSKVSGLTYTGKLKLFTKVKNNQKN